MNKYTKMAAAVLGVVATMGVAGVANATPMLQIVSDAALNAPLPAHAEAIGDAGGTGYPSAPSPVSTIPGAGLPTDMGGWPNTTPPAGYPPGFALDTEMPPGAGNYGISGWDASYLNLTEAATVTFQYMGKGDAGDHNQFQLYLSGVWTTIFDNTDTHGTCGASGNPPAIDCSLGGSVSYSFAAGLIPFQFVNLTTPGTATNDGSHNISPDEPPYPSHGGYFLGMDPYLATGQYDSTGKVVYAGFTDRGFTAEGVGDHDYEDLIVRMSVPEPGSIFLLGAGLVGLAFGRRRQYRNMA